MTEDATSRVPEHPRPAPLGRWAEVSLIAGLARREVGRRPGAWLATMLTGVLFAGLLLLVGLVSGRVQDRAEERSFKVAVGGDVAGASTFLERLGASDRIVVAERDEPVDEVIERRAATGLTLPEGLDAELVAGRPVELAVAYRLGDPLSYEALVTVLAQVQDIEVTVLTDGRSVPPPALTAEVDAVLRDERVARVQLGRQVGAVAALLCLGVVSAVAAVFGAARERRALEPLLVLPLRRRAVAGGVAAGTLPVASLQVLAGVALLVATAAVPTSTYHQPIGTLVAMLAGGAAASLLLAVLACAVGAVAGSLGSGTDDAVSLGDLLALPFVVVGIVLFVRAGMVASPAWCAVPGLGQALVVREAVAGTLDVGEALAAVVSTVLTAWALVALAGWLLADEQRLLRATR